MAFSTITGYFYSSAAKNNYDYTRPETYLTIAQDSYKWTASKLGEVSPLSWGVGFAAVGVAALAIRLFIKMRNRPQYPDATLKSSINFAKLLVSAPKAEKKKLLPNITLTFCIDTSSSMKGEREKAVKSAVNRVLSRSKEEAEAGGKIEIAVVGFDSKAKIICVPSRIGSSNLEELQNQVNTYSSSGSTSIISGLRLAIDQMDAMKQVNRKANHVVILLTDGGDQDCTQQKVSDIHKRLGSQSSFFAIGIEGHDQKILKLLAPETKGLRSKYIDISGNKNGEIETVIAEIYQRVIKSDSFSEIELSSPQLPPGSWSLDGNFSNETGKCKIGTLVEGTQMEKKIQVHPSRLGSIVGLSKVLFNLTFTDPNGRQGTLSLPWRPNTAIDPSIAC